METANEDNFQAALEAVESWLQCALDGNGARPWSEEYLREILRETLDMVRETLADA